MTPNVEGFAFVAVFCVSSARTKALVKDKQFIDNSIVQQRWVTPGQVMNRVTVADAAFSHPAMTQNPMLCVRFSLPRDEKRAEKK